MGLAAGVAVALAVIAVAVSAYAGTSSELHGQLDQSLRNLTSQAVHGPDADGPGQGNPRADGNVPPSGAGRPATNFDHRAPAFGGAAGVLMAVHPDGSSFMIRGTRSNAIPVTAAFKALATQGTGRTFTDLTVRGNSIRVLATGIGRGGALLAALPLKDVNTALSDQLLLLVLIAAGGIAVAALLGLLVARTALAPIARFTRQTEAIAAHPDRLDSERLDVHGGDELARLAQTFNRTLDVLEQSVQAQRNLVADASHELRTPIATIRANLQLMADEQQLPPEERAALRHDVIEELDELTALVSDVVELARGSKPSSDPNDVRLDQIVHSAVERGRRRAPELTIQADLVPTLVRGEGTGSRGRLATCSTTRSNGARRAPRSRSRFATASSSSATTAPALHTRTCRSSSIAFTGPGRRVPSRARGSGWRSCARPPRRTAGSSPPATHPGEGR